MYIQGKGFKRLFLIQRLTVTLQYKRCVSWDVTYWHATAKVALAKNSPLTIDLCDYVHTWAISFLRHLANMSSMVPSEHQLTPSLSPIGAPVRSHAVRRRLFIFLMTAAHISPNVFASETSSATYMYCLLRYTHIIHTYYTSHSYGQL